MEWEVIAGGLWALLGIEAFGETVATLFPDHPIPSRLEELTALHLFRIGEVSIFEEKEPWQRG